MKRAGVTLIELVVGLTIASALLAAAYAGMSTALDRREAALSTLDADVEAAAVRASLRSWLEGARVDDESTAPLFSGADGEHEGVPDDQLAFVTSAPTPLGSASATVRLYVDRSEKTPEEGLVAEVAAWLGTERTRIVLVPEAAGLDVRYRSELLAGRAWHPSWISSSVLPAGVELVVLGGADLHPLLRLPLKVGFEEGR